MTATEQKAREAILKMVENDQNIFIVGCGDCATQCQTGGEVEVAEMKSFLEEAGKTVTGTVIPDAGCHVLDVGRLLRKQKEAVATADALLVLACGAGVQAVTANVDKSVYPGCDTLFQADTVRKGNLHEWCSSCGDCVIMDYGGICPITRCPKGQVNGPCGGTDKGKCEVDSEQDCVWTLIYQRLEKVPDKEKVESTIFGSKNFQASKRPRQRVFEPRRGK